MEMKRQYAQQSKPLVEMLERHVTADGTQETAIKGLHIIRSSRISEKVHTVYEPSLCVVARGSKVVLLGEQSYQYDPASYLTASVHLPITGQVIEASAEAPYLSIQLQLDKNQILEVIRSSDQTELPQGECARGLVVSQMSDHLHDAVLRLVRLLDTPQDIPVLAASVTREIIYRVLQDEQNAALKQVVLVGSQAQRISKAIVRLNREYAQSLRVEKLAQEAHMSASSFHHYFKEVTGMSPIQYQKQLRLQEARRLLFAERLEAAEAAYQVGYESPSHFSREYARKFGLPPARDIRRLREMLG